MQSSSLTRHKGEGFTALPRVLLDMLLCSDLSKREILILLLIARLTYGCKGATWARVRHADLSLVGIGANHAKACLEALLVRDMLIQNEEKNEYQLNMAALQQNAVTATERLGRLSFLVSQHLRSASPNGKETVPSLGRRFFPNREETPSQNRKNPNATAWHFSRSKSRFVKTNESAIDN